MRLRFRVREGAFRHPGLDLLYYGPDLAGLELFPLRQRRSNRLDAQPAPLFAEHIAGLSLQMFEDGTGRVVIRPSKSLDNLPSLLPVVFVMPAAIGPRIESFLSERSREEISHEAFQASARALRDGLRAAGAIERVAKIYASSRACLGIVDNRDGVNRDIFTPRDKQVACLVVGGGLKSCGALSHVLAHRQKPARRVMMPIIP